MEEPYLVGRLKSPRYSIRGFLPNYLENLLLLPEVGELSAGSPLKLLHRVGTLNVNFYQLIGRNTRDGYPSASTFSPPYCPCNGIFRRFGFRRSQKAHGDTFPWSFPHGNGIYGCSLRGPRGTDISWLSPYHLS